MTFVSYAQNFEDVVLARALADVKDGFYIDIGAQDPVNDSVTKAFYEMGWCGINVEPIEHWFSRIAADRPRDINLKVAVSDKAGSLTLYEVIDTGMSTSQLEFARQHAAAGHKVNQVVVPAVTLADIVRDHVRGEVHFLKIDVEGEEGNVLRGVDLRQFRPWVILLESTLPNSMHSVHQSWERLLTDSGYVFVHFDGLNRFYLPAEREAQLRERLVLPPNFFDRITRIADLRNAQEVGRLGTEVVRVEAALTAANEQLQVRAARENALTAEVAQLQENARESRASLATLAHELEQSRINARRLQDSLDVTRNRLSAVDRELQQTYNSRSWRVTRPIRLLAGTMRANGRVLLNKLLNLNGQSRTLVRFVLMTGLAVVRRLRFLKAPLAWIASRSALLDAHLRGFARANPPGGVRPARSAGAVFAQVSRRASPQRVAHRGPRMQIGERQRTLYVYAEHTAGCPVNTGVQRVTRGLAAGLLAARESVRFVKWHAPTAQLVLLDQRELEHLANWEGPALDARAKADYQPTGDDVTAVETFDPCAGDWLIVPEVPYITPHPASVMSELLLEARRLGLRTAFVFYDSIPCRRPEMAATSVIHERYVRQLLQADLILPISNWSADELRAAHLHHERAVTGPVPIIQAAPLPGEPRLTGLPARVLAPGAAERLILCVGTIEARKNQLTLLRAFDRHCSSSPDSDWRLVLVGNVHPSIAREVAALVSRNSPRIESRAYVSDDELLDLYRRCAFTVFPSIEEGFGLPILESLWFGRPCVCANFGSMSEVARGGGCLTVDTRDEMAVFSAVSRMMAQPELVSTLSRQAVARSIDGWVDYANAVRASLDRAADPALQLGNVYYFVEHTGTFAYNTGIQRVVRSLAAALIGLGVRLVPVKWDFQQQAIAPVDPAALENLSKWNGPDVSGWVPSVVPASFSPRDWVLVPELTAYPGGPDLDALGRYCRAAGLRSAVVFYDTIPWKMREIYSPQWSAVHRDYLDKLLNFELILSISDHSRQDLYEFYLGERRRAVDLDSRLLACPLPGELLESRRVLQPPDPKPDSVRILSVGSIEFRKNHISLLKAFQVVRARVRCNLKLNLVGGCYLPEPQAAEFRAMVAAIPEVSWDEKADDTILNARYSECDFTVYPSLEEGFGLPILESLWNGRPCICRNSGAMREVAEGGGCLMVDTADVDALAIALEKMITDVSYRAELGRQAVARPVRTWRNYAADVANLMAGERYVAPAIDRPAVTISAERFYLECTNLARRPLLSICISTYNRGKWLAKSLENLFRLLPQVNSEIEVLVCDNTSTDNTPEVVRPYLTRADFSYHRNEVNVGMLGNLRVTSEMARGQYIWILGDDDLIKPGCIERIVNVLKANTDLALVYLNYSFTRIDDAEQVRSLDAFLAESTPIVAPGPDRIDTVARLSTCSENFFTAIYCLVFRRDHALRAYSQDTRGRPFSTMLTAIPTTYYVLHYMMQERACWIGEPQLVVNMNVSWMRYAPLWILERIPEVYDRAERLGGDSVEIDRWRIHTNASIAHFLEQIYGDDPEGNREFFEIERLITRMKHLDEFARNVPKLRAIYESAHSRGIRQAQRPASEIFAAFEHP